LTESKCHSFAHDGEPAKEACRDQLEIGAVWKVMKAKNSMAIKTIPLSQLETDLNKTLDDCAESGETFVIEMPDQRLLTIQSLDSNEDDALIDELIESNPRFQALLAKSKSQPRKPFAIGDRR
jgi:hypothetical protein